jgi:hypothetical protein
MTELGLLAETHSCAAERTVVGRLDGALRGEKTHHAGARIAA